MFYAPKNETFVFVVVLRFLKVNDEFDKWSSSEWMEFSCYPTYLLNISWKRTQQFYD